MFEYADTNKDKKVDFKEFMAMQKKLNNFKSDTETKKLFSSIDTNENGSLDEKELIQWRNPEYPKSEA